MFHLHVYLHRKLPFLNFTFLKDEEGVKYKENLVHYKGSEMYEFPECKVCKKPITHKIDWLKR